MSPKRNPIEWLAALDGAEVPGGCAYCDAVSVPQLVSEGVIRLEVKHDSWCPWFQARKQRSGR